jgi:hypothetical protein
MKAALNDLIDQMAARGVSEEARAAWAGGFATGIFPHAIAWNYGKPASG